MLNTVPCCVLLFFLVSVQLYFRHCYVLHVTSHNIEHFLAKYGTTVAVVSYLPHDILPCLSLVYYAQIIYQIDLIRLLHQIVTFPPLPQFATSYYDTGLLADQDGNVGVTPSIFWVSVTIQFCSIIHQYYRVNSPLVWTRVSKLDF